MQTLVQTNLLNHQVYC